ncbi:hypothetical protein [Pseudosporangium ferrugineum]|nr:hypothetical protein [Pseudosporangium ferrugineum]
MVRRRRERAEGSAGRRSLAETAVGAVLAGASRALVEGLLRWLGT